MTTQIAGDTRGTKSPSTLRTTRALSEKLARELDEAEAQIAELELEMATFLASRNASGTDDASDPEGPALAFERSQAEASRALTLAHAAEIRTAIQRLHAGTYGVCVSCEGEIAPARLEARPSAAYCISCASKTRR